MLPVVVVPKDVTPERVHVSIVDTPGNPQEVHKVDAELAKADVVVLVYDINNDESTKRIMTHWLPFLRAKDMNVPIILVGNKIDTRGGIADPTAAAKMEEFIKPIMDKFREVDVCIECSAKTASNISEVFYFAQKAVLYPTGQVYDVEAHTLKPRAAGALRRIFKQCDKDGDGGLNDKELNDFQFKCFNVFLKPDELEGVKRVVQENCPLNGLNSDGSLAVEGFVFLHTLFVQKGRLETTWIVLRKFGYDDDMRLTLPDTEKVAVGEDQSVELSPSGKEFLAELFLKADKDKDGLLSPAEMKEFFKDCPDGAFATKEKIKGDRLLTPSEVSGKENYISVEGMYVRWEMYLMDSLDDALVAFKYLGYVGTIGNVVKVTRSRRRERKARVVTRDVLNIAVLGCEGAMKTDVIRGLVNVGVQGRDSAYVAGGRKVKMGESQKTVVMRHVPEEDMQSLFESRAQLEKMDVMCVVFDGGDAESFEKGRLIWAALESKKPSVKIPVVFVAGVSEEIGARGSEVLDSADAFCLEKKLPTPTRVSTKHGDFGNLYEDLLGVALYPEVGCPDYYDGEDSGGASQVVMVAGGIIVGGLLIFGAKRMYDYWSSKKA